MAGLAHAGLATAQPAAVATAPAVKELTTLLAKTGEKEGPRFIAAEDPADPTRFVAAMLIPELQLLVVSAKYPVPVLLREHVLTGRYREAYQDLQATVRGEARIRIDDLLANGLALKPLEGQPADAVTRGGKTVQFDGQWRQAKLSEKAYIDAFEKAEKDYSRLLGLLIARAKQP